MTLEPLVRDRADAMIGGVCGALARGSRLDPLLVRIGFVVLAVVTGGVAVVGYLALWGLTPSRATGEAPLLRWFPFIRSWTPTALVLVVLGACLVVGAAATGSGPGIAIPLLLLWWLMRSRTPQRTPAPAPHPEPRTPFERLAVAWEQRLANVDAGRPVDWVPQFEDPDPHGLATASVPVVGSSVHRRRGRRSWFGVLVGVGVVWFACGLAAALGVSVGPLAWTSATLAVLAAALVFSARPSRAALGRPPLLATVTVLTGLLTASLLIGSALSTAFPQHRIVTGFSPAAPLTSGATDLGFGDYTLDYTGVPVTESSEVSYDLAVGDLELTVPATGNVVVTTSVGIGSIDTPGNQREGINVSDAFRRVEDPDGPTLTIDVRLRTGEVRVIEP